jgi:hypothetical protein
MRDDLFKKKFFEKMKKAPREAEPEEEEKKDPKGPLVLRELYCEIIELS